MTDRRQVGLRELDRMMRERAGLAPSPVPVPLHKMGAARGEREVARHNDGRGEHDASTGEMQRTRLSYPLAQRT